MLDLSNDQRVTLHHRHAFMSPTLASTVDFVEESTFGGQEDEYIIAASKGE
jgi:hypothetical protein